MGQRLRVLSTNLSHGDADPEALGELARRTAADIVAVQEMFPEHARALAGVLPHGRLEPERGYKGMGIAARHPASYSRIRMACRDASVLVLDPADWPQLSRPIEIVGVHIGAPHALRTHVLLWRHRQLRALVRHFEEVPRERRILIGDFNATPAWPLYRRVAERFDDAAILHANGNDVKPGGTWPRWLPWRVFRIDHCFSNGLAVESFEVHDLPGSDHDAIFIDFVVD